MGMDTALASAWIARAATVVKENADYLTELDAAIGDGDHGANMARGLAASVQAIKEKAPATPGKILVTAGSAMVSKTGGAAGPLYGTLLRRAGKSLGDVAAADTRAVAAALADGLAGVVEQGQAEAGDKTMVDALIPATESLTAAADAGESLAEAVKAAAAAATARAAATLPAPSQRWPPNWAGPMSVSRRLAARTTAAWARASI